MKECLQKHTYQFTTRCQNRFSSEIYASEELPRELILLFPGKENCDLCWKKDGEIVCPAKGLLLKRGKTTYIGRNAF